MELKDVILSTLAEMEDNTSHIQEEVVAKQSEVIKVSEPVTKIKEQQSTILTQINKEIDSNTSENEVVFLTSMRERLLVLFEGFQAPNNTNIEAKIDMTLNFLEYMLANIDNRVEKLSKENR